MIWVDRIAKDLQGKTQHIDDMFTPSGYAHIGSLRGPVLHHVVYQVLTEQNKNTVFTYVLNDFDPIDGLPPNLLDKFSSYMGYPLRLVPSPDQNYESFAEFFASDFKKVLESLGINATYVSSWDLYHEGKFNDVIKTALDQKEKILEIYRNVAGYSKKEENWYPLQVICPKCNKLGTTKVTKWDGKRVTFTCEKNLVSWTKGCGYTGTISPFDGNGKLPWKVDWPAHWKVLGVTFEGAGKDHASRGGSYDIAFELCKHVFNYPKPYYFPYEFFLFGGKKMSSSKGIGLKARDLTGVLPPDLARFLIVRLTPQTTLEFNPEGMAIPNLFDDYDRCLEAYFIKLEGKIPEKKQGEVTLEFARIIELSAVKPLSQKRLYLPRFRTIVNLIKTNGDLLSFFEKQKKSKLTSEEKEILEERKIFAQLYLKNYALKENPQGHFDLSINQSEFLKNLAKNLSDKKPTTNELVKSVLLDSLSRSQIKPKEAFRAIYRVLVNADSGPKAQDLILQIGVDKTINLFKKAQSESSPTQSSTKYLFPTLKDNSVFSIDTDLAKKFPSMNIGIAIIRNVTIQQFNSELNKETEQFLASQSHLTTEILGQYPEIQSYRKLYKDMKIDWHSRRPSPEALLRRIALKKGLYKINTCVDAYNLVVMKNRVSSGAFDLDKIQLPTIIRLAKEGEEILLLGDNTPTAYKPTEVAYFDKVGGYNIDFNYRDAQRTAVTEKTKNILINIDGVYNISRSMVEKTLQETIDTITKYCGGKVELAAIASAT